MEDPVRFVCRGGIVDRLPQDAWNDITWHSFAAVINTVALESY